MSFKQHVQDESDKMGSKGIWMKLKEGENVIRVLAEPEPFYEKFGVGICYTDCNYQGTPKYLAYVWDKADNKVKLFRMNMTIAKMVAALMKDEDHGFESFPMPYNIKITAKGAGTKEVEYQVIPGAVKPIDDSVMEELATQNNTTAEIIENMKKKQKENVDSGAIVIEADVKDTPRSKNMEPLDYPEDDDGSIDKIPF
jgi:hypothetical protein